MYLSNSSGNIYLHTVGGKNPFATTYFADDNIAYISKVIQEVLARAYKRPPVIPRDSIIRVMQRVLEERLDSIPKLNQRVVMYIANEYLTHQKTVNKHLRWEEGYHTSQRMYDPLGKVASIPIDNMRKIEHSRNVGGTLNYYFT